VSRSRKRTPVCGITTARSEKQDKRLNNRRYRHKVRQAVAYLDLDTCVLPAFKEVSNPWTMAKDGKIMFDPGEYPRFMRK
jgi:hypothetical protein